MQLTKHGASVCTTTMAVWRPGNLVTAKAAAPNFGIEKSNSLRNFTGDHYSVYLLSFEPWNNRKQEDRGRISDENRIGIWSVSFCEQANLWDTSIKWHFSFKPFWDLKLSCLKLKVVWNEERKEQTFTRINPLIHNCVIILHDLEIWRGGLVLKSVFGGTLFSSGT